MKVLLILCFVLFATVLARPEERPLSSKYDDFDVDSVIANKRLLKNYTLCFIGKGKCTSEGKEFKEMIPESIESSCGRCSPKQVVIIRKAIKGIKDTFPDHMEALLDIYDPERKRVDQLNEFLKEE